MKSSLIAFDASDGSAGEDSDEKLDDPLPTNSNYQKAIDEMDYLEIFNKKKYHPIMVHGKSTILCDTDKHREEYKLLVGAV